MSKNYTNNEVEHIKDEESKIEYLRFKALEKYKEHPYIKKLISKLENIDYVIAPIADNRMYRIINSFIDGEITDEQCKHCLAATNLGNQYVLLTNNETNIASRRIVEKCGGILESINSGSCKYWINLEKKKIKNK